MAAKNVSASFGNHNSGFQLAQNSGTINVALTPSDKVASPNPLSTVPFPRDPDYIHRGSLIDEIHEKLSVPAARVALVGLGGVGYGVHRP